MEKIVIHTENIQLDQLLKWAGVVGTGGEVKVLVQEQMIKINGKLATARRARLFDGDIVELKEAGTWQVEVKKDEV